MMETGEKWGPEKLLKNCGYGPLWWWTLGLIICVVW